MNINYLAVIEQGESSFGAWVPDLPGCMAVGESRSEVTELIREAVELHLENLRASGQPVPAASSSAAVVEIKV